MDVYAAHFDDIQNEAESIGEEFSAVENSLSTLNLTSKYLNNIAYLVDISLPQKSTYTLDNSPFVKITTGTGKLVFEGLFNNLEQAKDMIIEQYAD